MAFVSNQDELDQNQQNEQNQSGPGPVNLSTSSASIETVPNSSNTSPTTQKQTAQKGSGFVNLSSYLDQNKTQAGDLSTKVSNDIVQTGVEAKNKITGATDLFNQKALDSKTTLNPEVFNNTLNTVNTATNEQKADAQKQLNNTYSGPTNLNQITDNSGNNVYSGVLSAIDKTNQKANNSKTQGGRKELISQFETSPARTAGTSSLNNLLLQNDSTSKDKLENARTKVSGLGNDLSNANNNAENTSQFLTNNATQNKDQAQSLFDEFTRNYLTQLQSKSTDYNNKINDMIPFLTQRYNQGKLTIDDLKTLGFIDKDYDSSSKSMPTKMNLQSLTNDINDPDFIGNYLIPAANRNPADFYNSDDIAKIKALQSLGQSTSFDGLSLPTSPYKENSYSNAPTYNQALLDLMNNKSSDIYARTNNMGTSLTDKLDDSASYLKPLLKNARAQELYNTVPGLFGNDKNENFDQMASFNGGESFNETAPDLQYDNVRKLTLAQLQALATKYKNHTNKDSAYASEVIQNKINKYMSDWIPKAEIQ